VEVRVRSDIPFPFVSKNNVGFRLVGEDQKQFPIESLLSIQRMIEIIGVMPVLSATNPTFLPMPSTQWPPWREPRINTVSSTP